MNSSIADIVSLGLPRVQGSAGPRELPQPGGDGSPALSGFGHTLQALLMSSEATGETPGQGDPGLSPAELDSLTALAEASPDDVTALLEAEAASLPESAAAVLANWVMAQPVAPAAPEAGATAVQATRAEGTTEGIASGATPAPLRPGDSLQSIPQWPVPASGAGGASDGDFAGSKEPALAAHEARRGNAGERATLRQTDATAMPHPASDNPAPLPVEPSSETVEVSGSRETLPSRAEITAPVGSFSTPSSAVTSPVASTTPSPSAVAQMQAAMGSAQWSDELGEQVMAITLRGEQQVALHLNPRELGPLVIELAMVNNQAQLQFVSSQQAVRAAVEAALPELREHLAEQGIALGDANVSDDSPQQTGQGMPEGPEGSVGRTASTPAAAETTAVLPMAGGAGTGTGTGTGKGRVNLYI